MMLSRVNSKWEDFRTRQSARSVSRKIGKDIAREKRKLKHERKSNIIPVDVFLIGERNSGKSAVAQHLRMICSSNELPSESERRKFQVPIYRNIVNAVQRLLREMEKFEIPFESQLPDKTVETIMALNPEEVMAITPMLMWMIGTLWKDQGVQTLLEKHGEFCLGDSMKYFLENFNRITDDGYIPSHQDILNVYSPTLGVEEFTVQLNTITCRLIDTGGNRGCAKWIASFGNGYIHFIIFIASLSDFDEVETRGSVEVNKLEESFKMFEGILQSPALARAGIILLLNKIDILEEKIRSGPAKLADYFPDYTCDDGHDPVEAAKDFIVRKFMSTKHSEDYRDIYAHFMQATNIDSPIQLKQAVMDHIIRTHITDVVL